MRAELSDVPNWVSEIKRKGYVIVPNFLTAQEVGVIKRAFETEVPTVRMPGLGDNTGNTIRAHNLLAKTRSCDFVFLDDRLRATVEGVLGAEGQLNLTTLFDLMPGAKKQALHQDDGIWSKGGTFGDAGIPRPHPSFLCNAVIAIDDFDAENGATHVVPYSHTWHDRSPFEKGAKTGGQHTATVQASMKAGSVLFWEGALWHGGGANVSKGRRRKGLFISHTQVYLRQQEDTTLSVPREVARAMPTRLQRLLGYAPGIFQVPTSYYSLILLLYH
jgi:ectoine hydroxylase-related dioxygenase (phytanoyl-CoA dioxygenase family)